MKGLNYILDTFAIGNDLRATTTMIRDEKTSKMFAEGNFEHFETPLDFSLEETKIIIHNKNDVPMLFGPNSQMITIPDHYKYAVSPNTIGAYSSYIDVRLWDYDRNLKDSYPIKERECRYTDEIEGLQTFTRYSQVVRLVSHL